MYLDNVEYGLVYDAGEAKWAWDKNSGGIIIWRRKNDTCVEEKPSILCTIDHAVNCVVEVADRDKEEDENGES